MYMSCANVNSSLLWALTETWSLVVSFSLTLSHQSHCLIMNLNVCLYNTFSFFITYPSVIMSFPGKYSWNHIPQWWSERLLFLEEEETFVTSKIKNRCFWDLSTLQSCWVWEHCVIWLVFVFMATGNMSIRLWEGSTTWASGDIWWYAVIKSKCKMSHPFAGQWCSLMQFSAWS